MYTFKDKSHAQSVFLRECRSKGWHIVPVLIKQGRKLQKDYARRPKPQHIQYSKAVATLCDAVQEYGDFLGSVVAKDKYDKAIGAVRNLQAQAVIQSNMAI